MSGVPETGGGQPPQPRLMIGAGVSQVYTLSTETGVALQYIGIVRSMEDGSV